MLTKYMQPRDVRREARTLTGRFRGGVLGPIMAQGFRESESGQVSQAITYELDSIAGRMITEITAEVVCVFVPTPAIHAMKNPTADYPGNTEVVRQELLSGGMLFGLEEEGEISKRLGVVPRSIGGVKKVNEAVRHAHNAAVNHLRLRKYVHATLLDNTNTAITPALISQTVLDRLNGVLDPEDRVNGSVSLAGRIPVEGIGIDGAFSDTPVNVKQSDGDDTYAGSASASTAGRVRVEESTENPGYPAVFAELANAGAHLSLLDLYQSEKMDRLTREMDALVTANPQYGAEQVARFAHGLFVDPGKEPFVVYEQTKTFGVGIQRAMDGPNLDKTQSNLVAQHRFTVPIPATELGGILITFASVKPDETLASQPHPILSAEWGARNYVADEMALDPVPVTIRDLDGDCDQADENTIALYVGNNHLLKTYVNYGHNRHLNPTTVANKTALWQLEVPMSVTPESVLYPTNLGHYPFADQNAEVCTYTVNSNATVNTPVIFGPTPVEELQAIEDLDIFEDAPAQP